MSVDLKKIGTEQRNQNTLDIDTKATIDILRLINDEDQLVAGAVKAALGQIAALVDQVTVTLKNHGRLIYLGAGTSGRIGILDAVECRPTFGVSDQTVMCLMAGGESAFVKAVEGAEDSLSMAKEDLIRINLNKNDVVVGIAASGRTPYVLGGIAYAKEVGCHTGGITTSGGSKLAAAVDFPIEAVTGPEALTGSTRMKSGTAQKMICNMISTAAMIKVGKVYENLMVDMLATNEKLISRAQSIVSEACGLTMDESKEKIQKYGSVKKAIFASLSGLKKVSEVEQYLALGHDNIREALKLVRK